MKALAIAQKSLVRIWRDRTAMFFTLLLPFAIILIIGLAIGGFSSTRVPVGIVRGSGPLTADLVKRLDHRGPAFKSRGPFTVPRSDQGQPVIIQAGASGHRSPFGRAIRCCADVALLAAHKRTRRAMHGATGPRPREVFRRKPDRHR